MLRRRRKLEQRTPDQRGPTPSCERSGCRRGAWSFIDAGYVGVWSGTPERTAADLPMEDEELRAKIDSCVDLVVVSPDAALAARAMNLQQSTYLYDFFAADVAALL